MSNSSKPDTISFAGRLSLPGKILFKLLNDDQFYRDVMKSNRISINNFPKYDQWTDNDGFYIEFALAGFSKDDIGVSHDGNIIYIDSGADEPSSGKSSNSGISKGVISRGIARRSFKTSFYISPTFDIPQMTCSMKEGLLVIFIPIAEAAGPIRVSVN
jgi:HSP20 family molecular chaperone IbpA